MATHSDGQLDLDVEVVLGDGRADRQETPQETVFDVGLSPPRYTIFSKSKAWVAKAYFLGLARRSIETEQSWKQSSLPKQTTYSTFVTDGDRLDTQIATGPSHSFLRRIIPHHKTIRKLVEVIAARSLDSDTTSNPKDADEKVDARAILLLDDSVQQELRSSFPYNANTKNDDENDHDFETRSLRPPRKVFAIDSDHQSTFSEDSDGTNEYDLMIRVEGLDWEVDELLASFDTQSPGEFIFRPTLDRLGSIKEHNIPTQKRRPIKSPLNPEELITPTKFVRLRLWIYQIGLHVEVDLSILDVPEELNGFQLLLGRKFLRLNGGPSLLVKIVQANIDGPRLAAPVSSSFAPVRKSKRSKEQQAIDDAKARAVLEEQRRTHAELYRNWETPPLSAGSSMQTQSTSTKNEPAGQWVNHSSGHSASSAFPQVNYLPGPYYGQRATKQSVQKTTRQLPDYAPEWRTQRTNTSSTQFTQYSFGRQDTFSSISSWGDEPTNPLKEEGPAAQQGAEEGGNHARSNSGY